MVNLFGRLRARGGCLALCAALALVLAVLPARADVQADAKDLFARGRELRVHGDCDRAVPVFRKAYEIYPAGLGSLRNIAECEESSGHFASARRAWLDLGRALLTNNDLKYEGWSEDAAQAAAKLAAKLATLTIDLEMMSTQGRVQPPHRDVDVVMNGERLTPSLLGIPLERDPGVYRVRVVGAPVRASQERVVELEPGDDKRISLRVLMAPDAQDIRGAQSASADANAATTRRALAWASIGIGAASLIGMGISIGLYEDALSNVKTHCSNYPNGKCDSSLQPTLQPVQNQGKTSAALANVFGVVGAVGVVSGVVLLVTTRPSSTAAAVFVSPMGVSAIARF